MEIKKSEEWKEFMDDADKYLSTAINGAKRSAVFTPEILYNIIAMSIEKYFMGYLLSHQKMPESHILSDLVCSVGEIADVGEQLSEDIRYLDGFQDLCPLDAYHRQIPNGKDVERFVDIGKSVKAFIWDKLSQAS